MPVFIAEHAGFCMGVRRAVVEAMKAADMEKNIVTIGPLVHNPEVLRKLEAAGVRAVDTPEQASGRSAMTRRFRSIRIRCPVKSMFTSARSTSLRSGGGNSGSYSPNWFISESQI